VLWAIGLHSPHVLLLDPTNVNVKPKLFSRIVKSWPMCIVNFGYLPFFLFFLFFFFRSPCLRLNSLLSEVVCCPQLLRATATASVPHCPILANVQTWPRPCQL
jgi:hypothetical protein